MDGPIAIDFGNANTVIAIWQDGGPKTVQLRPFSRVHMYGSESVSLIPSVVHFPEAAEPLFAEQVISGGLVDSTRTVRSFKAGFDYIHAISLGDRTVEYEEAARLFVSTILESAIRVFAGKSHPIAITVPVDSFEKYVSWLEAIVLANGYSNILFIDEPTAAALSFHLEIKDGDIYLIFDFGASTLDLALVRFDSKRQGVGRHCSVLAKRAMRCGGDDVDRWIAEYILSIANIEESQLTAEQKTSLRLHARMAKEELSTASIASVIPPGGETSVSIDQKQFEAVLQEQDFFHKLVRTIDGVLELAEDDHSIEKSDIKAVFMVGGSSIIPSVQSSLKMYFGKDRVRVDRPLDAVARGACAFAAGALVFNHVQHDYALYFIDNKTGEPALETIVRRGAKYPSENPLAIKRITAAEYNQTVFEMLICELSSEPLPASGSPDEQGMIYSNEHKRKIPFQFLNDSDPCIIRTDRPVQKGHLVAEIAFHLDRNKMLTADTWLIKGSKKIPWHSRMTIGKLN